MNVAPVTKVLGLVSRSAGLMAARVMGAAAGLVTQLLLAHSLSANDLGLFYIFSSMAIVLGTVATLGYPGIANQLIARYQARRDTSSLLGFIGIARRDAVIVSLIIAAICIAAAAIAAGGDPNTVWPAAIAALAIPAFAMMRVSGGLANGFQLFALSFLPDNFVRPALFLSALAGALLLLGPLSLLGVTGLFTGLVAVVASIQWLVLRWTGRTTGQAGKPGRRQIKAWRKSGLQLVVPLLISALFADIAILGAGFVMAPAEVATFGLCIKIAFLFGFVVQVAHQLVMPSFASFLIDRDRASIESTIAKTNIVAISSMAAAVCAIALVGEQVLALFGDEFLSGLAVLILLGATQLVRALGGPALSLLIASGRHARGIPVILGSLLLFFVTCAVLAPVFGAAGAATAVLISTATSCLGLAVVVKNELGLRCDGFANAGLEFLAPRLFERRAVTGSTT